MVHNCMSRKQVFYYFSSILISLGNKDYSFRDDKKPPSGREVAQWMQARVTGV